MSKRVTIMLDDDNDKEVRRIQSNRIKKTQTSVSFSKVINDLLRKQLK